MSPRRGRSLLLVDNRESGGLKEEWDTTPCQHCPRFVKVFRQPYTHQHTPDCYDPEVGCDHEQSWCPQCGGMLCLFCGRRMYKTGVCENKRREMEKILTKYHSDRMWARLTGQVQEVSMLGSGLFKKVFKKGSQNGSKSRALDTRCPHCGNKELDRFLNDQGEVISQICRSCQRRVWIDKSKIPLS